jgi:hypothetical protein
MLLDELDDGCRVSDMYGNLNGYEKGVVARAFLKSLIRKASILADPNGDAAGAIAISVMKSDLDLLARVADDVEASEPEGEQEILLDELCQKR